MNIKQIKSLQELKDYINYNQVTVIVFSTHTCSVCKALKDKLTKKLEGLKVGYGEVFIEEVEAVTGEYMVFTVPIVLLFIEGKETKRYSAAINSNEFEASVRRYLELLSIE